MHELCKWMEIDKIRRSPYRRACNGMVVRFHRTLNSMLAKFFTENLRDRDTKIPLLMAAYRTSIHDTTGYIPNFLMFGREVRAPLDIVLGEPTEEPHLWTSHDDYVAAHQTNMRLANKFVRDNLRICAQRRKKDYDMRVKMPLLRVGDWVWYYYSRKVVGKSPKWQSFYAGPFLIVRLLSTTNAVIQRSQRSKQQVVHVDKLKLCLEETPASWLVESDNGSDDDRSRR